MRRTVDDLVSGDATVRASDVRSRARQLLGRDSESLSDRMFVRILKDAHDEGLIDLRRRGNDFEVARAAEAASVAEQVAATEKAAIAAAAPAVSATPQPRLGMGPRQIPGRGRGRPGAPPANLLAIGVVGGTPVAAKPPAASAPAPAAKENGVRPAPAKRGRSKPAAKTAAAPAVQAPAAEAAPPKAKRGAKKAASPRPRGKKAASAKDE